MKFNKIPILIYHSIDNDKSRISLDVISFEKQLRFLKQKGYKSINFNCIENFNEKQIIITFDDGYKDNLLNALPILKKYNFNATCFIITNFVGRTNSWDSTHRDYIEKEFMNTGDIREWISHGMTIGSHSQNHKDLTILDNKNLDNELRKSKFFLEDLTSKNIDQFCYPFGKVNLNVYENVKNLYKNAFTTNRSRYNALEHDNFLLPRIDMGKDISNLKMLIKLETIYEDIKFKKNEF